MCSPNEYLHTFEDWRSINTEKNTHPDAMRVEEQSYEHAKHQAINGKHSRIMCFVGVVPHNSGWNELTDELLTHSNPNCIHPEFTNIIMREDSTFVWYITEPEEHTP